MDPDDLEALNGLQKSVDRLRKELAAERQTRKWQGVAVVALIVIGALINGGLLLKVADQADQLAGNRVADCVRTNGSRAALIGITDAMPRAIFSALVTVTSEGRTPEEQARLDALVDEAARIAAESTKEQRSVLGPRDCSPEAVNP